jgi:hypothetical protein
MALSFKPKHVSKLIKNVLSEPFYSEWIVCPSAAHLLSNRNEVLLTLDVPVFILAGVELT